MKIITFILALFITSSAWATDVKISDLPAVTTPVGTDIFPVVQAGTTKKETLTQVKAVMGIPRVTAISSSATPSPNCDTEDEYDVTALATGATFAAPTGTPNNGQQLLIRIKDNGIAQTIAWDSIYNGQSFTLPPTTIVGSTFYMVFLYNTTSVKWDLVSFSNGAIPQHQYKAPNTNGRNTFLGIGAGNYTMARVSAATDASDNTGIGRDVFNGLTTGKANVGMGDSAGSGITTGARNVLVGAHTLATVSVANDNTGLGDHALFDCGLLGGTCNNNTGIGSQTLSGNYVGDNNTGVGSGALIFAGANFNNVTAIGAAAGSSLSSGSFDIYIGSGADIITAASESYKINIANTITGALVGGAVSPAINVAGLLTTSQTTKPTCSCSGGGSCSTASGDTDEIGIMTCSGGGASTTATLTFNLTHSVSPVCIINIQDTAIVGYQSTRSLTAPVFTFTSKTNPVINYVCR